MMRTIGFFFIFIPFFSNTTVFAINYEKCKSAQQTELGCCEFTENFMSSTQVARIQTRDKDVCTLKVSNSDTKRSFRRFGFASDGQVSIFIQPGGNNQKNNSMQSYLIFPFGENPNVKDGDDKKFYVKSGSGQTWVFDKMTSLPTSLEGCKVNVNSKFSLTNSGVKIELCKKHLVISTPVEIGGEYIAYPDKSLTVIDPAGESCQIKNSDLYKYGRAKDKRGRHHDAKMKFKSNDDLGIFLGNICPRLNVSMMLKASASSNLNAGPTVKRSTSSASGGGKPK